MGIQQMVDRQACSVQALVPRNCVCPLLLLRAGVAPQAAATAEPQVTATPLPEQPAAAAGVAANLDPSAAAVAAAAGGAAPVVTQPDASAGQLPCCKAAVWVQPIHELVV